MKRTKLRPRSLANRGLGVKDRAGRPISSKKAEPKKAVNGEWDLIEVHDLTTDPAWLARHPEIIDAMVRAVLSGSLCLCCREPLRPLVRRPVLAVISPRSVTGKFFAGFSCEHCYRKQGQADAPTRAAQVMRDYVYETPGRVELLPKTSREVH